MKFNKEVSKTIAISVLVGMIAGAVAGFYINDYVQARYDKAPVVQVVTPEVSK